ncbi:MAG TPA: tetratricopeptide repeat protein [Candidatus Acidoferrales bacterium]|nr:tetratricopeptide repeat protein [Candidatus Acidoferrales bacterium]
MAYRHFWRVIARFPAVAALAAIPCSCAARAKIPLWADATEIQARSHSSASSDAERDLQTGIALTQQGHFSEAIPHFLAAQGHVSDEYAVNFNLALCYVGTEQFGRAIHVFSTLKANGHDTAAVNSLLAQAYVGTGQDKEAFRAFQQAVKQTPEDEKLYMLVAEECMDRQAYDLGLDVLNIGLRHLPNSSRLHYERGVFFSFENESDPATADFDLASKLSPGSDIFYMAAGQKALLDGNIPGAVRVAREGIKGGHGNYILLTIFGKAVVQSGVSAAEPEFREAQAALEKSVAERPNYAESRAALGELYLMAGRVDDAIADLEVARKLAPDDASVYSHLAIAYRRKGDAEAAKRMLAALAELNQEQAAKYKSGAPGQKAGYISTGQAPRRP